MLTYADVCLRMQEHVKQRQEEQQLQHVNQSQMSLPLLFLEAGAREAEEEEVERTSRYSISLLYWYNSTNTDAATGAGWGTFYNIPPSARLFKTSKAEGV